MIASVSLSFVLGFVVRLKLRGDESMPQLKTYRLFISHSWAYSDAYDKLVKFFKEHSNFSWIDYSVPRNDPIHNAPNEDALYEAIKNQMQFVNCVVMLAGVYSTHSKWINKEISIAKNVFSKPLIAIEPWGSERTSRVVKDNADAVVKWQSASIVSAIREHSI
jgi:hypothetical protein